MFLYKEKYDKIYTDKTNRGDSMKNDLAIVFLGNDIFYQSGVFKAILKNKLYENFTVTTGIGLGALTSILFARKDYKSMDNMTFKITQEDKLFLNKEECLNLLDMHCINKSFKKNFQKWSNKISKDGIYSWYSLLKVINDGDVNLLYSDDFNMECLICCYILPFMLENSFEFNKLEYREKESLLLNVIAQPMIFTKKVRSKSYITPEINGEIAINQLIDRGYKNILVINSQGENYNFDKYKDKINIWEIKNCIRLNSGNMEIGYNNFTNFIKNIA
ncbi:hypothetical protein FDF74_06790 [Clostridium niameyense]|uniref:PNPLA domain-containing protein n=2 Tax=Clostridium niameyense TaxID=1622073 RepID=A0A6M0RAY9_9CLOT|nr:hypothetical protein [Clostridium niameyense]